MTTRRIGFRDGSASEMRDDPLSIAWVYDLDACRGATGVTRHALGQLRSLSRSKEIRFQAVTGRIGTSDGLIQWQELGELKRSELPLSTPNMLRLMRTFGIPHIEWWTGKVDWAYSPAEYNLATRAAKRAVTSHDILQDLRFGSPRRKEFLRLCFDQADLIVSVSEFNSGRLLEAFPFCVGKVVQVPNAADDLFHETSPDAERRGTRGDLDLPNGLPYILSVANFQPRKNLARMIRALGRLSEVREGQLAVVLVGEGEEKYLAEIRSEISRLGPKALVRLPGYVQGRRLRGLYAEAAVLCFPSVCESFGIPAVEAMAQGVPVALAGDTALPEVGGEAGWYFDPLDEEAIANAITSVMNDDVERKRRVRIGLERAGEFRWDRSRDKLLAELRARR